VEQPVKTNVGGGCLYLPVTSALSSTAVDDSRVEAAARTDICLGAMRNPTATCTHRTTAIMAQMVDDRNMVNRQSYVGVPCDWTLFLLADTPA